MHDTFNLCRLLTLNCGHKSFSAVIFCNRMVDNCCSLFSAISASVVKLVYFPKESEWENGTHGNNLFIIAQKYII